MDVNDFDEFCSVVGTKAPRKKWYVYFNKKGFLIGIQSPYGSEPGTFDHYRVIRWRGEADQFLREHSRPDLIEAVHQTGFHGRPREIFHNGE